MYVNSEVRHRRRGAVAVLVAVMLPVAFGFVALSLDVGYMYDVRTQLQASADAAAHAATIQLPDQAAARQVAKQVANSNFPNGGTVLLDSDILMGNWNSAFGQFTPNGAPVNAVRVITRRSAQNGNAVNLLFASTMGIHHCESATAATAYAPGGAAPPISVGFLIDDEMFDTDIPAIEDYADSIGWSTDALLEDNDNDNFIDFPPTVIELLTGQVGDGGLFDVGLAFPFTHNSNPSLEDFLLFEEGGNQHGISTSDLDPLLGVEPMWDPNRYPEFVNPDAVMVSPVYKSDVSDTDPGVNALGERRGLVAFKILAVGTDPDGNGSMLPNLIIEIVDPSTIAPLGDARIAGSQGVASGDEPIHIVQ